MDSVKGLVITMADPDKGRGGGHPDPGIKGGGVSKIFFSAHRASVLSKNKGGGPPSLDPPL